MKNKHNRLGEKGIIHIGKPEVKKMFWKKEVKEFVEVKDKDYVNKCKLAKLEEY